ncbi:MAG: Maf-like protein [Pseudomonadota bacterium]
MVDIILASKSVYRSNLLSNAGVSFSTQAAEINEREVEAPLLQAGLGGADVAEVLAIAKATHVSQLNSTAYVIGSDQTLSLDGELLHKPANIDEARRRLLLLSGRSHDLNSAITIVRNGEVIWNHVEISTIRFRELDPGFVGRHMAEVGDKALTSVGAYQIEGLGIQLFDSIEGDFFSIMGLPVLPLLKKLRELKLMDG